MNPKLSIIIVSYNSAELVSACIETVYSQTRTSFELIVVDNDSKDNTVSLLRERYPGINLMENPDNRGFATASNQGLELASGDYAVLLNPDTLIESGALDTLYSFMDSNPHVGACAPRCVGTDMALQYTCHSFPTLTIRLIEYSQLRRIFPRSRLFGRANMTWWSYDELRQIDWATGACLMIRSDTLRDIGLLDSNYFLYVEEVDWSLRARLGGWPIMFVPDAQIVHHSGATSKGERSPQEYSSSSISEYLFASQYYYFRKHYGPLYAWTVRFTDVLYGGLLYTKNFFWSRPGLRSIKLARYLSMIRLALDGESK